MDQIDLEVGLPRLPGFRGMGFGWVSVGFSWVLRGCHAVFSHKQQGKPAIGWTLKQILLPHKSLGWVLGGFLCGFSSVSPTKPDNIDGSVS